MQTKCNTCCRQRSSSVTAQSFPRIVCIVKSIVRNVCRLRVEKLFVNAFHLKGRKAGGNAGSVKHRFTV